MKVDDWKTRIPAFFRRPSGLLARFKKHKANGHAAVNTNGELEGLNVK
jgi:hypothetical protein